MRTLIALFACSCVALSASAANDPAAAAAAKLAASVSRPASAMVPAATKKAEPAEKKAEPKAEPKAEAAASSSEEDAEVELSAKIAQRLAALRERQQARATAAARAKKLADAKRKQDEQTAAAAAAIAAVPKRGTVWSYEGETGPANWSKINVDWAKCGTGNRQSPIDLRDGIKVNLEQISFDYHPSSFSEVNNGHTIQVTVGGGNFITVGNAVYELQEFHFHRPSEEKINGKGTEMVIHLVHKSAEGKIAIVAVLLERGQPHRLMQTIWDNLPLEKFDTVSPAIVIDPTDALPERREYFTYMGSLTEPPCTEGVLWMVFKQPMQASPAQMALFSRLYPLNARPVQSTAGRMIKESN
ncbi:carbonic anhydrase family protein [Telluria mixta]|uniref:carbonic anhydrase n=1 Tax=Telluria mixta TaxID=34071 RepID=A0ABT2BZP0_9BURK|nr:carbonic anhydrase family protein [Telluria mixta]MCS0630608.1 carbonic anhydrase family protein [Telluria mixta]WEM98616.1 carbonic anhydrase family protein [Telluria mixta]